MIAIAVNHTNVIFCQISPGSSCVLPGREFLPFTGAFLIMLLEKHRSVVIDVLHFDGDRDRAPPLYCPGASRAET